MKTIATPILLVAAALTLALLLALTTRTGSGRADAPVRPTSSPAAGAHNRVVNRYRTRAACHQLFGHDSDSHGELGQCLAGAR
jgi:hypothetical protein